MNSDPLMNPHNCYRVLVADDDLSSQLILRLLLEKRGYAVAVVGDGQRAVDALEREHFDIVLMDVQMPILDGYSATRAIREREALTREHLPIVAVTAQGRNGDEQACLAAGMDGYVAKPFRMGDLLNTLEGFLRARALPPATLENKHG